MNTPERVPATVKGLSLVSLFNDFASEMVYPLLPAFISRTLGGSAALIGALDGAADLTSALLKWVSGRLADRPGWRRPLILWGYATAGLGLSDADETELPFDGTLPFDREDDGP